MPIATALAPPPLEIERHRLANGLRLVLHRDASLPLVAINLWYHTGSKNERRGKTGFAHLFEHMLFQGSAHVGANEHFRWVQGVGGVANGSTWYDRTNYYETLPASSLELGLWLESDRMGFLLPGMTAEKLETQRQVVMNERRQRVDNQPYGRAAERVWELLFPPEHPYSWPVIGTMEDIAAATLDDVREFFSTWYVPDNAVLTLAGDFDPGQAVELVERYFGEIPAGRGPRPAPTASGRLAGERFDRLTDRVQLPRIYLAYTIPAYGKREWYAADLLSHVLAGGKASRLHRDLVHERELAQSVASYALPTEACGSFHVVATAKPGVPPDVLGRAIDEHLAAAADTPAHETELERVRNRILTGYFAELQTLDRRADLLSQLTTYFDRPEDVTSEIETYQEIDAGELQDFASRSLRPDHRARLWVEPAASELAAPEPGAPKVADPRREAPG
ncbi:MAG TPA: pitrilysin family protein [Thermoanaerobaculia bacterium]|nr:pitrilysin family protein [Thermoanaerobaculia bacterium]